MSLGEVNKGAIALILVLLIGAGGYLWYSQMYTPAVEARTAAQTAEQTAQGGLSAAKSELAAAQERIEQARSEAGKLDDSVGKVALATKAIPREQQIDDAAIVLMDLADRAGISTTFPGAGDDGEGVVPEGGSTGAATPIDLEFKAAGTYAEMMLFMSLVEDTVVEKNGKLHTRDRLFNVTKLQIGVEDEEQSGSGFEEGGSGEGDSQATGPIVERGDMLFTVTVRMYTSSTDTAASVGANTPDAAAAPLEDGSEGDASGAGIDGAATGGGDPNAAGAAPIDGADQAMSSGEGATGDGADTATSGAGPATGGF